MLSIEPAHLEMLRRVFEEAGPVCAPLGAVQSTKPHELSEREQKAVEPAVQLAHDLLQQHGYPLVVRAHEDEPFVELWRYHSSSGLPQVEPTLAAHVDDGGAVGWDVCTALFYLQHSCTGGGLFVAEEADTQEDSMTLISVRAGTCVLMRGDVLHEPQACSGDGLRDCIAVQLKRKSVAHSSSESGWDV